MSDIKYDWKKIQYLIIMAMVFSFFAGNIFGKYRQKFKCYNEIKVEGIQRNAFYEGYSAGVKECDHIIEDSVYIAKREEAWKNHKIKK